MSEIEFDIDRDAVRRYFQAGQTALAFLTVFIWGIGIILAPLYFFTIAQWLCPRQANNLRYRLEGSMLRADGGVLFLFRKSIPLERITDVNLVQGPLMRFFGIWAMKVQTAGSPQPEATLYGVREPEKVREIILSQRRAVYGEKSEDA